MEFSLLVSVMTRGTWLDLYTVNWSIPVLLRWWLRGLGAFIMPFREHYVCREQQEVTLLPPSSCIKSHTHAKWFWAGILDFYLSAIRQCSPFSLKAYERNVFFKKKNILQSLNNIQKHRLSELNVEIEKQNQGDENLKLNAETIATWMSIFLSGVLWILAGRRCYHSGQLGFLE